MRMNWVLGIVIPMESVADLQVGSGNVKKVTEKEQEVIALLLENANYTMPQLAEKLKISRKTIAVRLKSLKEKM